ncbi:SDR family NAD(P)-dependent oxidoreductase [Streptomyces poonensis]|uniref:Polyketide synthase n=1 Tax=Streptomyces poonensis TaxID=68255 RepID=A0A918ULY8_9ACTN|nr:SDR family NAD(P)-dependent oxidoreductase [Streptomyces poonensis]GGZ21330.1 hypothetical protein GCM10010365_47140 [Streptomyces poonensis]
MDPKSATGSLHVTPDEVLTFARVTGDASPLHVDASYARRTPFGEPVAHGLLCLLKVIAGVPPLAGRKLAALRSRFSGPVLLGQDYAWTAEETAVEGEEGFVRLILRVLDGRRTLIEAEADFVVGELRTAPAKAARPKAAAAAAVTPLEDLSVGQVIGTAYRPDWEALAAFLTELSLSEHGVGAEHVAVLGWASHLAGMEAPGRAAMISGFEMECGETAGRRGFTAKAEIAAVDERFRTVRLAGEAVAGRLEARVTLRVVARREAAAPSAEEVRRLLGAWAVERPLAGRSAFVTGGSRGLGAALVQSLAIAGCTVHTAFRHGRDEAEALVAALGPDGARIRLHQGDAADAAWCADARAEIEAETGPVDLLFLNAGPPAHPLDLHTNAVTRAGEHVRRGLELAQAPLTAFAEGIAARGGRVVAISSAYVSAPRRGLSHYVAAKHAVEGLVRTSAAEYPGTGVLVVRPPRLATTFADSVVGADDALAVEPVAVSIVRRIVGGEPGTVEVMEDFSAVTGTPEVSERVEAVRGATSPSGVLAVAGTFTTDPLHPILSHWTERLGLDLEVRLTPYNQVFQELLDPASTFAGNRRGCNIALVRLEDWPAGTEGHRTLDEFAAAATAAARRGPVPLLVALCPPSPGAETRRGPELEEAESRLRTALDGVPGLHVLGSGEWSGAYPVAEHHDAAREEHAHIPYTPVAYTALGTALARKVHSLLAPPFKVLVLDCDNTLWSGVCGEDGSRGVGIGPGRRRLQEWAVELHDRGVLLCLCSKNEDEDVDEVFRQRTDMPLRLEHIAARRVNWDPKPDNLAELARELGLGLDSMVFLDDNPVEIAAVRAAHPEVLALPVPGDEKDLPAFLDRLWAFDRADVTDEDRQRTAMYRAARDREALRGSSTTLAEFIAGLDLRIDVHEARPEQLPRVAQLTQRTNQFNLSTVRRSESELRTVLDEGARCWVAEVADRFGEYGLVGAAITRLDTEAVVLDTFLMSCRVLGRGVEHAFLAAVASKEAEEGGPGTLEAVQRPTAKNRPARLFFDVAMGPGTAHPASGEGAVVHRAALTELTRLAFRPDGAEDSRDAPQDTGASPTARALPGEGKAADQAGAQERVAALAELTVDLTDATALHLAVNGALGPVTASTVDPAGQEGAETLDAVRAVLSGLLRMPRAELRHDTTLESLRLESLQIVDATVALEERFGRLPKTLFFEHRTLGALAAAIAPAPSVSGQATATVPRPASVVAPAPRPSGRRTPENTVHPDRDDRIAVVGIAGRYPGAADVTQLWHNLVAGTESLGDAAERWGRSDLVDPKGGPDRTYTSAGGLIEGVDEFDALFFNIAPSEAETMDPQQRIFLQVAYHALEDAGHTAASLGRNVGVYVASMGPDYAVLSANAALDGLSRYPNSDLYQIANRVSYFLDFTGPSIAVDTACSGSGVALQLACDALRAGTVSAAIAGGVNLILHPARRIQYAQLGMLSRTGRCRPFGAGADGMVTSEGVGAVLLRPLRDALADGDHVYGVIRSVGTNSDGRTNGFTVPSPDAQAALIGDTLRRAGVDPATIGYVEAHGTGTPLGDPIEIRGLSTAFGPHLPAMSTPVGSIKGNIGHTEAAAAVAGLTKVLLQFEHQTLVPSLHADELNPHIDFDRTPFLVQRAATDWGAGRDGAPRRASLSSFGAGGVNVHMVLEEAPVPTPTETASDSGIHLMALSARDDEQLRLMCGRLAAWLRGPGERASLADVAYTLRTGRAEFASRLAMSVGDRRAFLGALDRLAGTSGPLAEAARDVGGGVSYGRAAAGTGLADVFDGSSGMVEVLCGIASRGDLAGLGRLWCQGAAVDWTSVLPRAGQQRVPMPGYPFRRTRHWLREPSTTTAAAPMPPATTDTSPLTYYAPRWVTEPAAQGTLPDGPAVVVIGGDPYGGTGADRMVADVSDIRPTDFDDRALVVIDRRGIDTPRPQTDRSAARETEAVRTLARLADAGREVTYACVSRVGEQDPFSAVVPGFGRALAREIPRFRAIRVEVAEGAADPMLAQVLAEVPQGTTEVRLHGAERQLRRWAPIAAEPGSAPAFREGGHYLVTGGGGGIGTLLAMYLAERYRASVTLTGRSPATPGIERLRAAVRAHGGDLLYLRADVTDASGLADCLASARAHHGPLHGVIHAAGVLHDGPARDRTDAETAAVLAPKLMGTVLLDEATAGDDLDFFLVMSSFVGTFGNAGQAAYCAANRFLDAFCEHRTALTREGERRGRSVSAVWPLWEHGGMAMPPAVRRLIETTVGLTAIDTDAALRAMEDVIRLGQPTVLIGCGDPQRISAALAALEPTTGVVHERAAAPAGAVPDDGADRRVWLRDWLRREAAALARIPYAQVDTAVEFGDYGFNSMLFTDFANRLNEEFRLTLTPVVFYEAPTVDALAKELCDRHRETFATAAAVAGPEPETTATATVHRADGTEAPESREESETGAGRPRPMAIAVIGMAGRFPGAHDLDSYWDHIMAGRDLVTQAPAGRFGDTRPAGGFLEGILAFDAAFFGISPREARLMDPQQRLFLEEAWHALEDAGYDPQALSGSRTGVFVGATLSDYTELLSRGEEAVAPHSITGHVQSVIANRLSYLLDLRGPSEVIDTACSSSLTALHRALGAIETGECELAVAGGVNALFSPDWFASLKKAGMLSATGRCWTFDERADGFVRGEGVGVVVLKPLDQALSDGDDIRAVIRGSAVNHGGRAHSLTAPNPDAQADVVVAALRRADFAPRTVSYIETHGTGTKLGDPIEVAGLTKAFARLGAVWDTPWCQLGAVKGNIGHLESAAGMAGLLKILLALRHRTLPPNAVGDRPNRHLNLTDGPFEVLLEAREWRPVDAADAPLPLRAGVSAFGFGGANAHVVVEEPPAAPVSEAGRVPVLTQEDEQLIVLSATDADRLREYARRLRETVAETAPVLADLAYTSRVARGALPTRLAAVASDRHQLLAQLDGYLAGKAPYGLYTGEDGTSQPPAASGLHRAAIRWVAGEALTEPADPARRRVRFPVYPFDHSTSHGPVLEGGGDMEHDAPVTAQADGAAHVPQLMGRRWRPAPAAVVPLDGRPLCLLLVGRDAGVSFMEGLAGFESVRWVVAREPSPLPALAPHQYETEFDDYEAGRRIAERILSGHGPLHAVIDLVDASGGAVRHRERARIGLLQTLVAGGRADELRLVHVRRVDTTEEGSDAALNGARFAALVRAIGAEYGAVRAVTVETDGARDDLVDMLDLALREVAAVGEEPEVRYREGARQVARLAPVEAPRPAGAGRLGAFAITADRPYVITGGTGGLGLAAAELLVERGARKLVLAGLRALPPRHRWPDAPPDAWWAERVAAVQRLEAAGAEVMLHSGSLTEPSGISRFLSDVRVRFGRPAGVLHCAGAVAPTRAFIRKRLDEILACWEPKGTGPAELARALAEDEPDFVVLYSSLSAVVPRLAVGLTDYASANAALDALAAHAARHGAGRGARTHWLAIDWGSWAGAGMGEVTSPRYRELGLSALTRDQGLALLDSALSVTGHTSLVAVTGHPGVAGTLLESGEPEPAPPGVGGAEEPQGTRIPSARSEDLVRRCVAHITDVLAEALLLDRGKIRPEAAFVDLGIDSILIAGIVGALEPLTGAPLDPSVILEHPSVARLADHLCERYPEGLAHWAGTATPVATPAASSPGAPTTTPTAMPLAVVGMASRFPGAAGTAEFWELLRQGRSGVREVPRSRWDVATLYSPEHRDGRSISKWGGFLEGIEDFDPGYFGIPGDHAAHVDPLTRLFLETAEQTFADAGYRGDELAGRRVGVFVGSGTSTYGTRIAVPHRATATGLNQNFIGAHLAHFRDLRGPNLVVDTACSSSLTSLYLAHQSLQLGECEMALVGGADLILDETPYLSLSAARALSPDGACRVFDAGANGFVPGEGVGAVLVKPLDRALADGDRILAVIEATAMNNDGRTMGLTTPNPEAQQAVVRDALRKAGAGAASVSYVEAHGTGTMIGDPIELRALTGVFGEFTSERGFCSVGSVKSNVGHLLMAAGMASLHKVVLSLVHGALPPTLHCDRPNPRFAFDTSPFRLQTELGEWRPRHGVRRAGISAFGFGGTNCHVVVRGLTDAERDAHTARRTPLPAPVFRRQRHWVERPAAAGPRTEQHPRPLLELEELI